MGTKKGLYKQTIDRIMGGGPRTTHTTTIAHLGNAGKRVTGSRLKMEERHIGNGIARETSMHTCRKCGQIHSYEGMHHCPGCSMKC